MKLTKKENRRLYDFMEEYCKKNEIQILEMKCSYNGDTLTMDLSYKDFKE